jgi:hypothetical protein
VRVCGKRGFVCSRQLSEKAMRVRRELIKRDHNLHLKGAHPRTAATRPPPFTTHTRTHTETRARTHLGVKGMRHLVQHAVPGLSHEAEVVFRVAALVAGADGGTETACARAGGETVLGNGGVMGGGGVSACVCVCVLGGIVHEWRLQLMDSYV